MRLVVDINSAATVGSGGEGIELVGITRTIQDASPASGDAIVIQETANDVLLWLSPSTSISSCTVQLPSDGITIVGEEISIGSSKAIATLSVTGATSIVNAATTMQAGDLFKMKKVSANMWVRQE